MSKHELFLFASQLSILHRLEEGERISLSLKFGEYATVFRAYNGEYYVNGDWVGNVHGAIQKYVDIVWDWMNG